MEFKQQKPQRAQPVPVNAVYKSNEQTPVAQSSKQSDEQFESAMSAFSKKLEDHCNEAMRKHAKKLRPNYDKTWIVSL